MRGDAFFDGVVKIAQSKILIGDVFSRIETISDKSINCCVTSPPYYGLRDYGTAKWIGGNESCDHKIPASEHDPKRAGGDMGSSHTIRFNRDKCYKCGAIREDKQIGIEETPNDYIQKLTKVFQEVWRVLRDDGTLWVNIGDSYCHNVLTHNTKSPVQGCKKRGTTHDFPYRDFSGTGMKTKDIIGIPWMLAFALRGAGWYLRQDIIWAKPNPMPESVTDRCTKAHEYIFLLSKSRKYYFDYEIIKEPAVSPLRAREKLNGESSVDTKMRGNSSCCGVETDKRNKRSVWSVATRPYKGAHFATFPPALIEPCILAGCPEGGVVLDIFAGSGTTGKVANDNNRNFIGIEINPNYVDIMKQRIGSFEVINDN